MRMTTTADAAHHAITGGGGVSFTCIHRGDRGRQFCHPENEVGKAATQFTGRTVIVRRRIVDIGAADGESFQAPARVQSVHGVSQLRSFQS